MCSTSSMCQDYRFGRPNPGNFLSFKKQLLFFCLSHIITVTEPNTPLNDADHVGSFNFEKALALCDENIRRFPFLPHNYMNRFIMEGRKDRKDYEMAAILNPELRKEEIHQPLRCDNLYKCGSSIILEED